jgi:hypothetical protein
MSAMDWRRIPKIPIEATYNFVRLISPDVQSTRSSLGLQ